MICNYERPLCGRCNRNLPAGAEDGSLCEECEDDEEMALLPISMWPANNRDVE